MVKKIMEESKYLPTFTNINSNQIKNIVLLKPEMIIKKEVVKSVENKKTGEVKEKYRYLFNIDFWAKQKRPLNIYLDEAGLLVKARSAMTHLNIAFQDFLALSRKICTESDQSGDLVMSAQTLGLIDITCRSMAHQIIYCVCYYVKYCDDCHLYWNETSEDPEPMKFCPRCHSFNLRKCNFTVRERRFKALPGGSAMDEFERWRITFDDNIPYQDNLIHHAEKYFKMYNTFQLFDMFSGFSTETMESTKSESHKEGKK